MVRKELWKFFPNDFASVGPAATLVDVSGCYWGYKISHIQESERECQVGSLGESFFGLKFLVTFASLLTAPVTIIAYVMLFVLLQKWPDGASFINSNY